MSLSGGRALKNARPHRGRVARMIMAEQRHIEMDEHTEATFRGMLNIPEGEPLPGVLVSAWQSMRAKYARIATGVIMPGWVLAMLSEVVGVNIRPKGDDSAHTQAVWESWRHCCCGVPVVVEDDVEGQLHGSFVAVVRGDGHKLEVLFQHDADHKERRHYPADRVSVIVSAERDPKPAGKGRASTGTHVANPVVEMSLEIDDG